MKKILLLSLLCFNQNILFSMEEGDIITDTQYLFDLSYSDYTPFCLDRLIVKYKQDPTLNINYQNEHGTTIALNAATSNNWKFVDILLNHGADKNIKDKYKQSLLSKALHDTALPCQFVTLLQQYTPEEINAECKSMPLHRDKDYQETPRINPRGTLALTLQNRNTFREALLSSNYDPEYLFQSDTSRRALEENAHYRYQDTQYPAAYNEAFNDIHIPHLVSLLKSPNHVFLLEHKERLACFQNIVPNGRKSVDNNTLFVLREAFNDGSCISSLPIPLISWVLFVQCFEDYKLPSEIAQLIQQKYIRLLIQDLQKNNLPTVEEFLWQPVCIQACQLMGIEETNEQQCLARILLMLQKQKTELNVKLLLAQEEKA